MVPRGSTMQSISSADQRTPCEFRTAQDVTLWPIEIVSASYFTFAPDLPITSLPAAARSRAVRIRLKAAPGVQLSKPPGGSLLSPGADESTVVNKLYELCVGNVVAALVAP